MILKNKTVAVIGAGPVGLAFANLLQQNGVSVTVYERDLNQHIRIKGGTLDLLKNMGQVVFSEIGILNAYFDNARPTARRIADIYGNIIQTIPSSDNPEIDRNDLRKILAQSLKPETIKWNRKLTSIIKQEEQFLLHFANGTKEVADLVVGANGIMSSLRSLITDTPAQYTGTIAVTGEVLNYKNCCPVFENLSGEDKVIAKDDHTFFLSQPKANGDLYYYICFRQPESWVRENPLNVNNRAQITQFLIDRFANWHAAFKEVITSTTEFNILPLHQVPLKDWRPHQNITLLGDAAHGMPPYAGVGVNTGLLDASVLAKNLISGNFDTIQASINDYEEQMFIYASEAQQQTAMNEKQLFS